MSKDKLSLLGTMEADGQGVYTSSVAILEAIGLTTIAGLSKLRWDVISVDPRLEGLGSWHGKALLHVVSWMADKGLRFKDLDPAREFPSPLGDARFHKRISNALLRMGVQRLEMLRLLSAEDLAQGGKNALGTQAKIAIMQELAKRGLTLRG